MTTALEFTSLMVLRRRRKRTIAPQKTVPAVLSSGLPATNALIAPAKTARGGCLARYLTTSQIAMKWQAAAAAVNA